MIMLATHFTEDEAKCKCGCGKIIIKPDLLERLTAARVISGIPFKITSWTRCKLHNAAVGGASSSTHLTGEAVDIEVFNSVHCEQTIKGLLSAKFPYIRLYENHVHVDVRIRGPQGGFQWASY